MFFPKTNVKADPVRGWHRPDRHFFANGACHILAFEDDSHVEWFEGNFQDYEKDKMRRLGQDSIIPHRVKYKKLTR